MKPRLNSLAWLPSVTSGGNLAPSLRWSMVVAASCCGDVFSVPGTRRLVRIEGKMNSAKYRELLDAAPECSGPQTGANDHLPTGQRQRRMGETPQIQVCQACCIIPKKTQGCNHCQRCFNKVLSKGCQYWCNVIFQLFYIYIHLTNFFTNLFLLCRCWLLFVDWLGGKHIVIHFRIRL